MAPYISTKDMSREEWLEARRNGIGGSDCAAIMGASPWSSPLTVYQDKLGLRPDKPMSEAMIQGNLFEDVVARRFAEETNTKVQRCNKMFSHPDYPWMLANIDRQVMCEGEFIGLECKTTSVYNKTDFEGGDVQPNYWWQCQHYMAVTNSKVWYLAVMVLSQSFHIFRIDRDEDAIERLIATERTFWEENVMKKVPPLPIGTDCDADILELVPATDEAPIELDPSLRSYFDELELLKADEKRVSDRKDEIEQIIKQAVGEHTSATCGLKWELTYKASSSTRVDSKRLKKDAPEIYDKYSKTTTSRTLRITSVKDQEASA